MEEENKNSSPVLKGGNTLGLESWILPHIYPYAQSQLLQRNNHKSQSVEKIFPCLFGVALLNPDMPLVWSLRRNLILSKKLSLDDELRLTRMALSRKPKCNEALAHRRWILLQKLKEGKSEISLFYSSI